MLYAYSPESKVHFSNTRHFPNKIPLEDSNSEDTKKDGLQIKESREEDEVGTGGGEDEEKRRKRNQVGREGKEDEENRR